MQEQMKFAFMNEGGVLADDGVERDPVSGNEVPAGSMAEEVRDDVPAMLSEGEYVVPADVVRFHGIDKFEELRDEAKMGLARMEADGRIGGQPVEEQEEFPFPVEELEGFNEGGAVGDTYSSVTGSEFKANQPYGAGGGRFPGVGFELRNFTNPKTGRTVVIPFFNGRSMQYIPPDFLEGGATTTQGGTVDPTAGETDRQESEAQAARGMTPREADIQQRVKDALNKVDQRPTGKSFDQYTSEDWNNYIRNADSKTADVTAKLPAIGLLQRMSEKAARSFAKTALRSGKNPATEKPLSTEEKLTLERVLMVAPNTSMTESIINAVTGKGETIEGLPLTEQAGFEFGDPITKRIDKKDVTYKPVTKLPDDLLPDLSSFKEQGTTRPPETPQTLGVPFTQPTQEYYGPEGQFQNIIDPQPIQDGTATQPSTGFNLDSALFSAAEASMPKGQNIPLTQTKMKGYNEIKASGTKQDYENLLQRIVVAEAGSEDLIGQALVARSILNRKGVLDDNFSPSTFYTNSSDLVDIIYGGNTESGVDNILKGDVQKAVREGKGGQYEPVTKGIITDPSKFNSANMTEAASAIALAQNPTKLKQELRKKGYKPEQIKNLMASTGFANLQTQADRGVKDDKTQDVNRVKYGRHTFNTAGNEAKKVYNPNPYEGTIDQGAPTFAGVPLTSPFQTGQAVAGQVESQPLQQTFVPPQAPTADQIRLAGGIDAFARSQLPTGTEQRTTGLQDLPVGVSIEADGQFTGTGGLGAVQPVRTPTPVVKRDFLDPNMAMSRREELSDPRAFRGPTGAGLGPIMSEDESLSLGRATDFNRFGDRRDFIPAPEVQPFVSPAVDQTEAMLGGTGASGTLPQVGATAPQPVAPFTPLGKPSDIAKLMPSPAEIEAQKAAEARKAREEQERRIYEESQKKIAEQMKAAAAEQQAKVQAETKETAAANQARLEAKQKAKMDKRREKGVQAAVNIDTSGMSGAEVLNAQQDAIMVATTGFDSRGNLVDENVAFDRDEDSGGDSGGGSGGGGFGGGSSGGGGDDKIVCTEMYRQTQLVDWQKAMKIWDVYQRRYLTPEHQIGYHWLFKPYVKGMQNNKLLTKLGAALAKKRTQHLKHILTKGKAKDDLVGKLWCSIIHPIVHKAGKIKNFLDSKTKAT
jgi:hypothetical protein